MARIMLESKAPTKPQTLMQQLAALAQQRSELLASEAGIWEELSRILREDCASSSSQSQHDSLKPDSPAERLLSVPRAADYLSLSKNKLDSWRLTGGGPEFVRLGRRIFYRRSSLDQFITAHTYAHTSGYTAHVVGFFTQYRF